jgi:hypothetical protein
MHESDGPAETPPASISPPADVEENSTPLPAFLNVRIEGDLAQAVQERAARFGWSAEDTVRRAVEDMLRHERMAQERQRQQSEPLPEQMTVPVVCDDEGTTETVRLLRADVTQGWRRDLFTAATKRSNDLYAITVQEMENRPRNAPCKHLLLRECNPDYRAGNGNWIGGAVFIFPVSKIEWLIGALERAQRALEAEARMNRQAAHQARRLRAPEEVDEEREQRQSWIEKRGREAWNQARTLASAHRSGALRLGLMSHFTAWEWLELCERFSFRCPLCGLAEGAPYPEQERGRRHSLPRARAGKEVRLQPHHRRALAQGGDNTIENILPLCGECHSDVHNFTVCLDASPGGLKMQRALLSVCRPAC